MQRQLQEEAAARQLQLQEESERRMRELDERQRELREETELHQRELENAQKLKKQQDEMENLQAELRLREREEVRGELGSDYDSDGDRFDVTHPTKSSAKPRFPLETEQDAQMREILHAAANNEPRGAPSFGETHKSVGAWLHNSVDDVSVPELPRSSAQPRIEDREQVSTRANIRKPAVAPSNDNVRDNPVDYTRLTRNLASDQRSGFYHEKLSSSRQPDHKHFNGEPAQKSNTAFDQASNPRAVTSDAALFSRALLENRMPVPKQLEFDGNPKTFMAFLASFRPTLKESYPTKTRKTRR